MGWASALVAPKSSKSLHASGATGAFPSFKHPLAINAALQHKGACFSIKGPIN
jgi:hypothetical protein